MPADAPVLRHDDRGSGRIWSAKPGVSRGAEP